MAKTGSIWGIDLGQCALKALLCRAGDEPGKIVAEAFDFIEYPKILGQPDANPAELMKEALETFLSRNTVKGMKVAISVSGQSGLARFIKLPPVESKKVPDIVKYEARQQIPFALEDVVWDYQQMAGGSVEEGFALETEVGLFAMKRDQVNRALRPFTDAGIEVEIVQLTPVALYNFVTFDQMPDIPPVEQYNPEDPPPSVIVMSLGAGMSDLVVTNGYRVWQRTVNLGGNNFTKALTKQMKLTFAKAEHLKRNAMKAEDPKAVFQAMRPVFGELLEEVQRSLSFFQNLDRTAKLGRVIPLGNAMKLRGLHKYLAQNLGLEVAELDGYRQLSGSAVTSSPAFKDNFLSFGACYGLCVQGLGLSRLSTNLLPREIVKDRMIRAKKPWAVVAVAMLLLGCTFGYLARWREWNSAQLDAYQPAFSAAKSATAMASAAGTAFKAAKEDDPNSYDKVQTVGQRLSAIGDHRVVWAELLKAVNDCLPKDDGKPPPEIDKRNIIYVDSIDCEKRSDLTDWIAAAQQLMPTDEKPKAAAAPPDAAQPDPNAGGAPPAAPAPAPAGGPPAATPAPDGTAAPAAVVDSSGNGLLDASGNSGWIVMIKAHHYHNHSDDQNSAAEYVRGTLLKQLREKNDIQLADVDDKGRPILLSTKDLGIDMPVLVSTQTNTIMTTVTDPNIPGNGGVVTGPSGPGMGANAAAAAAAKAVSQEVPEFPFVIEFIWKPTPYLQRQKNRLTAEKQKTPEQEQPKVAAAPAG
ncbi:MAG TPA: type IV pilus assembly protein PilM [Pirellulales bacterium]|jgi:type IV pilus assembly protein PilM|nr:type IV pilus assembly protein PilM [Pirellulales bacterium]